MPFPFGSPLPRTRQSYRAAESSGSKGAESSGACLTLPLGVELWIFIASLICRD